MNSIAFSKGSVFRIVCAGILLIPLVFFFRMAPSSLAADDQATKAVRRASPEGVKKVALVIGNSDYKVGPLQNPAHDAEDISSVLRSLGFDVQTKTNVNQREMEEAVNKFVQEIQNGDVALFYFSGHGVQVRGDNYLMPLGDTITSETDVRYKTINAGLILGKMEESRNRTNIVILDACRNNPFKGLFRSPSMGLSKMDAPKGTFIAYATSPDSVAADGSGRNSPYTKYLIEALKVKDIPIELAFKRVGKAVNKETGGQQTPWTSSSLLDDFYFYPSSPVRPQMVSHPASTSPEPVLPSHGASDKQKEAMAENALGDKYYYGMGVTINYGQAAKHYEKAAEQGNAHAQAQLGEIYYDQPEHFDTAVKWSRKAAEQGNAQGQARLGFMYSTGRGGVSKDRQEALKWYKKASDQGNATAQNYLGVMYREGDGVPKDYNEALKWFKKAAEQGHVWAQFNLGGMYKDGHGVSKDQAEAIKWYRKAADQGIKLVSEIAKDKLREMGGLTSD